MLSTMLLSRFRTLEEYGTYSQLQLVITVVVTILMAGLPNSINYFVAKASDIKEQRAFMSVYYTLCTISGILSGVLLIILIPFIENYFNNSSISIYWYFLLLYPWTKIILSGIENILVVFSNIKKLVIFKTLYSVITLGVIAFCWVRNISFYTATVFSTIIIFCALISLIVNIKRKSTIKILLSIVLPIIAVIISQLLEKTVLLNIRRNGMEASSMIFIIATLIVMTVIFLTLIIMIFKKTKK